MEVLEIQQITREDIRSAVRSELEKFFKNYLEPSNQTNDEIGGIELATEVTGKAKATIYSLCSNRSIPHSKKGKKLYFSRNELIDWIAQGKRKTTGEIAREFKN